MINNPKILFEHCHIFRAKHYQWIAPPSPSVVGMAFLSRQFLMVSFTPSIRFYFVISSFLFHIIICIISSNAVYFLYNTIINVTCPTACVFDYTLPVLEYYTSFIACINRITGMSTMHTSKYFFLLCMLFSWWTIQLIV